MSVMSFTQISVGSHRSGIFVSVEKTPKGIEDRLVRAGREGGEMHSRQRQQHICKTAEA
jgi:hypothetical protein